MCSYPGYTEHSAYDNPPMTHIVRGVRSNTYNLGDLTVKLPKTVLKSVMIQHPDGQWQVLPCNFERKNIGSSNSVSNCKILNLVIYFYSCFTKNAHGDIDNTPHCSRSLLYKLEISTFITLKEKVAKTKK